MGLDMRARGKLSSQELHGVREPVLPSHCARVLHSFRGFYLAGTHEGYFFQIFHQRVSDPRHRRSAQHGHQRPARQVLVGQGVGRP